MNSDKYKNVDDYISRASKETQPLLIEIRQIIKEQAPEAEERISYQMPAYFLNGPLVYFGGFKNHVSLFAAGSSIAKKYAKELEDYKQSKGTIQFPLNETLPKTVIANIVKDRVLENEKQ